MLVSELAWRTGISAETVRYCTRIGLIKPCKQEGNGYRRYAEHNIHLLYFIQRAKLLGFSLKDIRLILDEAKAGKSPCPRIRDIIKLRIADTRQRLEELQQRQIRMEEALAQWDVMPDKSPDGKSNCHLIESIDLD